MANIQCKRSEDLMNKIGKFTILLLLVWNSFSFSDLPTPTEIYKEMGFGFNIGNTMEVPENPTLWGNPYPTKDFIDSIKAAGFKTVRIPTAWFTHSDTNTYTIHTSWLDSVKTVVDYCINNDLYVILNSHWDKGWLEDRVNASDRAIVLARQSAYWTQIANYFKDYDEKLLFAGANEPGVNDVYGTDFGQDRVNILNEYHQAFIDAVRSTGGNNTSRSLIISGPRTDIELTNSVYHSLPVDPSNRLMVELHFYPWQFALMEIEEDWGAPYYYWGLENYDTNPANFKHNSGWNIFSNSYVHFCDSVYIDSLFDMVKEQFTSKGIPVILGEFGVVKRLNELSGEALERHLNSRNRYYNYVAQSAKQRGIVPVLWDTGYEGDLNMTVLRRQAGITGSILDYGVLNAMREAYGLPKIEGKEIDFTSNKSLKLSYDYTIVDSAFGQAELGNMTKDFSKYHTIEIKAYFTGKQENIGDDYGFFVPKVVVMTGDTWDWREGEFGEVQWDQWYNYNIPISTNIADTSKGYLIPNEIQKVNFFAIQTYQKYFTGEVYIDHIVFISESSRDTLYSFDQVGASKTGGAIIKSELIPTEELPSSIKKEKIKSQSSFSITKVTNTSGHLVLEFNTETTGLAKVQIFNSLGQVLYNNSIQTKNGINQIQIQKNIKGPLLFHFNQNGIHKSLLIHNY